LPSFKRRMLNWLKTAARKKPLVVFLGDIGIAGIGNYAKSKKIARMAPNVKFVGIDLEELTRERPKNLKRITTNFETGLKKLEDNSVSLIRSDLAVGHYDERGNPETTIEAKQPLDRQNPYFAHTLGTLNVAYRKLKPGGKFVATLLNSRALEVMMKALAESPFEKEKIKVEWHNRGSGNELGDSKRPKVIAVK